MTSRAAARIASERFFYTGMAAAILLTVFVGFAPSYYLVMVPGIARPIPSMTPLVHLHGLLFSTWIALFIVQTSLIAAKRPDIHRQLGAFGAAIAVGMVIVGTLTALHGVARAAGPPIVPPLSWLAVPLLDVPVYGGLIAAGLIKRRVAQTHKRLMLIAMIGMLSPAIGRMPWPHEMMGPGIMFGMPDLFLVPLILWDVRTRGRLHPVTIWAGAYLIGMQALRIAIWQTDPWLSFAGWAASLVA